MKIFIIWKEIYFRWIFLIVYNNNNNLYVYLLELYVKTSGAWSKIKKIQILSFYSKFKSKFKLKNKKLKSKIWVKNSSSEFKSKT